MSLPVPDEVFVTLHMIDTCDYGECDDETGIYYARFDYQACALNLVHFDLLESKGWIDMSREGQVSITEKGRYWLGRFRKNSCVTLHREKS